MDRSTIWFEQEVAANWSAAVMEATHQFKQVRQFVLEGLRSASWEVRSAAVATLNEANDRSVHDLVVALANDTNPHVREEVLEYIEQFPKKSDAPILLEKLRRREHLFLASSALRRLCDLDGPLMDGDESPDIQAKCAAKWEELLRENGYLA